MAFQPPRRSALGCAGSARSASPILRAAPRPPRRAADALRRAGRCGVPGDRERLPRASGALRRAPRPRTRCAGLLPVLQRDAARVAIVLCQNVRPLRCRCRLARPERGRTRAESDRRRSGIKRSRAPPLASTAPEARRAGALIGSPLRQCTEQTSSVYGAFSGCEKARLVGRDHFGNRQHTNELPRLRPKPRKPYVHHASAGKSSVNERTAAPYVRERRFALCPAVEGRRGFARVVWKGTTRASR